MNKIPEDTGKQEPKVMEFAKCPACGSTKKLSTCLIDKLKAKGWARAKFECSEVKLIVIMDPIMQNLIPMGSQIPAMEIRMDICLGCGCQYAVKVIETSARVSPPPTKMPFTN